MTETDENEPQDTGIKHFKRTIIACIKIFSECLNLVTDDEEVKRQLGEVEKLRLEFREFSNKSIESCMSMVSYCTDLQAMDEIFKDPTITLEDTLEELDLLKEKTRENKEISKELYELVKKIIENFSVINGELYKHREDIERELHNITEESNKIEAQIKKNVKGTKWGGGIGIFGVLLGIALAPITEGLSIPIAISATGGGVGAGVYGFNKWKVDTNVSEVSLRNELSRERDGLYNVLVTMIENIASIAVELIGLQTFWESQDVIISEIQKKLVGKMNKAKFKVINKHSKEMKYNLEEYVREVRKAVEYDKMTNGPF